jgi:hypothetical protein
MLLQLPRPLCLIAATPRTCNGGGLEPLQHRARQVERVHIPAAAAVLLQLARQGQPLPGRQLAVQWRGLPVIAGPAADRSKQHGGWDQGLRGDSICSHHRDSSACRCACVRRAGNTGRMAAARCLTCLPEPPAFRRGSGTAGCRRSGAARPRGDPPAAPCITSTVPGAHQVWAALRCAINRSASFEQHLSCWHHLGGPSCRKKESISSRTPQRPTCSAQPCGQTAPWPARRLPAGASS